MNKLFSLLRKCLGLSRVAPGNILVIDVAESNRAALGSLLESWNCRVLVAESTTMALRKMAETAWTPDVVLVGCDLLSDEIGIAAIQAVRAQCGKDISGVLITDDSDPEHTRAAHDRGYLLLRTPIQPARLRSAIRYCLLNPS